jgi:putative tricarboxylic transport membrane protein
MAAAIIALSSVGTFSINNSMGDVYAMLACGLLGVIMMRLKIPVAPAVLGLILGGMAEDELRRALMLADSPIELFTRPLSAVLVALTILSLVYPVFKSWRKKRAGQQVAQKIETVSGDF